MAHNGKNLYIAYQVADKSPWQNTTTSTPMIYQVILWTITNPSPRHENICMMTSGRNARRPLFTGKPKPVRKKTPLPTWWPTILANASRFDVVRVLQHAKVDTNIGPGGYSALLPYR